MTERENILIAILGSMAGPTDGQRKLTRLFAKQTRHNVILHEFNGHRQNPFKLLTDVVKAFIMAISSRPDIAYIAISRTQFGSLRDILLLLPYAVLHTPIVAHVHGADFQQYYDSKSKSILTRIHLSLIDHYIFIHEEYGAAFEGLLPFDVLRNPRPAFPQFRRNSLPRPARIGFISSFIPGKGLEIFLHSAQAYSEEFRWVLAGGINNGYRSYGEEMLNEVENSPFVCFLGYLKHPFEFYAQVDFLLFPSSYRSEALPGVVLEAMASGCVPILKETERLSRVFSGSPILWFDSEDDLNSLLTKCKTMDWSQFRDLSEAAVGWLEAGFPSTNLWVREIDDLLVAQSQIGHRNN